MTRPSRWRTRTWLILAWTAAFLILGVLIEVWNSRLWSADGDCSRSEDEIACAGAEGGLILVKWFVAALFFALWVSVWYLGLEAIRFVAERRNARNRPQAT